jgi:hypothetical protein
MFERYRKSMVKSEAISNKIYTNLKAKKIHIPILYKHICRDVVFSRNHGEDKLFLHKPSFKNILFSIFITIKYTFFEKKYDTVLCVQENMFNYYMKNEVILKFKVDKIFNHEINPILGLKLLSYFFALAKIIFNTKRRKIAIMLKRDENGKFLLKMYFKYTQQVIHAILTKKLFSKLIYFSLGTPSYGRYIYSNFHELQHGLLHDFHPSICPVKKPKGLFILSSLFSKYSDVIKSNIIYVNVSKNDNKLNNNKILCFPTALPDGEKSIIQYVKGEYIDTIVDFFYHPRSAHYKLSGLTDVKHRIDSVINASKIITSVSTVIIDSYNLGNNKIDIILTPFDCKELGVYYRKEAAELLSNLYMVTILEKQIIILDR